ncbi:MAG: Hg(II)-responsive transcriptional regulator [Betaproteobacteria bacterium]|nr:Hg(II)-responsive transcriptional regulator [Betaproteobacteria bacterium]
MARQATQMTIGGLAKAAGVNIETVRYYQRRGLLPEPERPLGGIRRYGGGDLSRLGFIKSAQRLGFSLEEIALLLKLEDGTGCEDARVIAEKKLADVRGRIADLQRIEAVLDQMVRTCHARQGSVSCPMIASLLMGERGARPA